MSVDDVNGRQRMPVDANECQQMPIDVKGCQKNITRYQWKLVDVSECKKMSGDVSVILQNYTRVAKSLDALERIARLVISIAFKQCKKMAFCFSEMSQRNQTVKNVNER